jgi:hypothetical protein
MKRKPGFDDEFHPKGQRWSWPVRSIGRLMIVVAVCGAALSVMVGMGKHKRNARYFPTRVQRRLQAPQVETLGAQPRDPFVVVAAAEIDAQMVVPAPAGIDEAMVFNPYTRARSSGVDAPAPGSPMIPLPGNPPPGQAPYNVYPPQLLPQWPAPTQPR